MTSTFGTFTVARLGILAASQGLNVTGNNITNINTENYVRQNLDQFSLHTGGADREQGGNMARAGSGVQAPSVSHSRDIYLDIRYRNAASRVGEMDARVDGCDQLSTILDEVTKGEDGEGVLEAQYNEMLSQMSTLMTQGAGKDQYDTLFRASVSTFVHQLNKTASDLNSLAQSMEDGLRHDIRDVNDIIDQIRTLNASIRKNEIYGQKSLEQQDQRDALLDDLAKYMQINVTYEKEEISPGLVVDKLKVKTATEPNRLLIDGVYAANVVLRPNSGEDLGAVNSLGIPVPFTTDEGAITDVLGNMTADAEPHRFTLEEAQETAAMLNETVESGHEYRAVPEQRTVVQNRGTVNNEDRGPITSLTGALDGETPLVFSSVREAREAAQRLTQEANGNMDYRADTDANGAIIVKAYAPTTYTRESDAQAAQAELQAAEGEDGRYTYSVEQKEAGKWVIRKSESVVETVATVHKYAAGSGVQTFTSEESAKAWADTMNQETACYEYRVEGGTNGEPYTVHQYSLNYDLNLTDLTDTHGLPKIVKEIDLGAVKNNDKGPITDTTGATEEGAQYLTFSSVPEANQLATRLTEESMGLMEFRVMADEDGILTIHAFAPTVYTSKIDALNALEAMDKDTSEHINSAGEATHYYYQVTEQAEGSNTWEIRMYDIFRGKVLLGDTEVGGALLADREMLTEKGCYSTEADLEGDADAAAKRGIPFYMHALDSLANHMANTLNEANQLPDSTLYVTDEEGNFLNEAGEITQDRAQYVLRQEYQYYNGGILLSNHANTNDPTYITARNISISKNWANGSFRVLRSTLPNAPSAANDNLEHIYSLLTRSQSFYPQNQVYDAAASEEVFFAGSYQELLTDHVAASLASDRQTVGAMQANYAADADELFVNRDGVMGVDLNDEAMNIMKYQKAYSAACRLMSAYDEMLDRMINGMAV